MEIFFYNRTAAYDEILRHVRRADEEAYGESALNSPAGYDPKQGGFPLDDPEIKRNTRVTNVTQESKSNMLSSLSVSFVIVSDLSFAAIWQSIPSVFGAVQSSSQYLARQDTRARAVD